MRDFKILLKFVFAFNKLKNFSLICLFLRWEEEYTMRMDLQQKISDLQEVII